MRKARSSPTQTWIACKNCGLPTTSHLHFFAHNLHLKSCCTLQADSCASAFAEEISAQIGQITSTAWTNNFGTLLLQLQQSHPSDGQIGKTRMAPKTSKTTTAWWPVSKWNSMPLVMKCQSKIRKAELPQHKPGIALGKLVATDSLAASRFCRRSPFKIILHPASWWLSQSCDSCASAFALEIPAQRAKQQAQLGRTIVAPCFYNFNSRTRANWQN